jgi:hypothetical protein
VTLSETWVQYSTQIGISHENSDDVMILGMGSTFSETRVVQIPIDAKFQEKPQPPFRPEEPEGISTRVQLGLLDCHYDKNKVSQDPTKYFIQEVTVLSVYNTQNIRCVFCDI